LTFASIARPIADILKGEHRSVSRHRFKSIQVQFKEPQRLAFQKLRNILASEDVILRYPDYKKAFDLTTDASAHWRGAIPRGATHNYDLQNLKGQRC